MRKRLLWILFTIPLIFSVITMEVNAQDHDIAIVSVTTSTTRAKLGDFVNINVTVANEGSFTETFNVTLYYDSTQIETPQNVTDLVAGANYTLSFVWSTTDVAEEVYAAIDKQKTYEITATASTVSGETDTADNTLELDRDVTILSYYIAVVPDTIIDLNLTQGENFTVSIYTDYNGSDVWNWEFSLTYNPFVLKGVSLTNGDLIHTDKDPSANFLPGTFNNTIGKLSLTGAFFFYIPPEVPHTTSGPGVFANVTFTVVGMGDSNLTLGIDTRLKGYQETTGHYDLINTIKPGGGFSEHLLNGYFRNSAELPEHDVAIISVTPFPTSVFEGESINITVIVENKGDITDSFDVVAKYLFVGDPRHTAIRIDEINVFGLAPGAQKTLTFSWRSEVGAAGNYTIIAIADLPTDGNMTNNERESIVVTLKIRETPIPIELILGIGVVVVGIIIALAIYNVKLKKKR
jgi:hypothetical protein